VLFVWRVIGQAITRIRVSHIRIIFWFDEDKDVVYVDHIGARGNVYKN
jgi:mRNA interferase RelE/StbE